jgi:uncharacterized membrane protein (TIGR02234 family)
VNETSGRRTFAPVVLLGLAGAGLAAVAGAKPWASLGESQAATSPVGADPGEMPLAGALALVVLACWGVVLVTRGLVRRSLAALALVAALGTVATVVAGWSQTVDQVRTDAVSLDGAAEVGHTGWWWAALVGSVLAVVASALAVRLTPRWPEMGRRYDAPGAAAVPERPHADPDEQSSLELWKALDEGHDPTDRADP